jgi:D-lactate dehydrogenase
MLENYERRLLISSCELETSDPHAGKMHAFHVSYNVKALEVSHMNTPKPQRIVFFEMEPWETRYLLHHFPSDIAEFTAEKLTSQNVARFRDAAIVSTFIYSDLSAAILSELPALRMIATRSTGYEHIALEECRRRGIIVSNVPSYGENTVAEHTFALILTLSRNVHKAYFRMKSAEEFSFEGLQGFDLKGKTIGVIGAGHIGMHVIKIARGFSMHVLAYDVQQSALLADVLNFEYVSLEEILSNSDVITLHVPYNRHTHQLINARNIRLIKKGAILINTSRGGLVETQALLMALNEGILSGVGLDVLEGEKLVKEEKEILTRNYTADELRIMISNHLLMNKENVVITPHIAFNSREAIQRILDTTRENIEAFRQGKILNAMEPAG